MPLKQGDRVNVKDCSWSYVITDKLEEHKLKSICGMENWTIVGIGLKLPTPDQLYSNYVNDAIIRKDIHVAFIQSRFLKLTHCPECGQNFPVDER